MNLNDFAQEIHHNSCAHGFWPEDMTSAEVFSLIHSEWSEALESYRNDEPMYFHVCNDNMEPCTDSHCKHWDDGRCVKDCMDEKPEGAAVELIDGCIRLLDACAAWGWEIPKASDVRELQWFDPTDYTLPHLVCALHEDTTCLWQMRRDPDDNECLADVARQGAAAPIYKVFYWLNVNDIDPEALMLEKYHYNLTRPYKHGKKI